MQKLENFRIICQLVLELHNSINGTPKLTVIQFFLFLFFCRCVGDSGSGLMGQNQLGSPMVDYLMLIALTVDIPPLKILGCSDPNYSHG
jgi:hypothetical protein